MFKNSFINFSLVEGLVGWSKEYEKVRVKFIRKKKKNEEEEK